MEPPHLQDSIGGPLKKARLSYESSPWASVLSSQESGQSLGLRLSKTLSTKSGHEGSGSLEDQIQGIKELQKQISGRLFGNAQPDTPNLVAAIASSRIFFSSILFSSASCAARKRRERCWFIFALGATPSVLYNEFQLCVNKVGDCESVRVKVHK